MVSDQGRLSAADPASYSNIDEAKVTDVFLKLDLNFDRKVLDGSVTLTIEKVRPEATHVLLDSRDLQISGVVDEASGQKLDFSVAEPGFVGSKVEVKLPTSSEKM